MEQFAELVSKLNGIVWGPYMLALLVGTGVWLTIRLAGLQFHMLAYALKQAFTPHPKKADGSDHEGDVSHFGSLMTALSATIGTGNIAGVATAVTLGGPGAVFWMWITAIFGMATKYAEGLLAVKYRVVNERGEMNGGPMYYIERGLNMKWLAVAFALFGALASFGIGSSVQANSVAEAVLANFEIDKLYTGIVLMVLTGIVVLGGIRSIAAAASAIVPLMAVIYVLGGLVVLLLHFDMIVPALGLIVQDAFSGNAVAGGAMGMAVRYGVARGVFSNEAGMGSAPIAAAAARTDHPVRQALVSMTGTFLDTIIVCSITGLVLTIGFMLGNNAFPVDEAGKVVSGAALTSRFFDALLPGPGGWIVAFGLIFFAYSTILGWCYYGEKCVSYLFGEKSVTAYRLVYVASVLAGTIASLGLVWDIADTLNGMMALPNLIALLLLTKVVVSETKDFSAKRTSGELP
ncbi:MAG: sodium:alanine symporter family protein [Rhodocyclaceae bacterium]|nr:sodium:alanine symporter family protein [Rhodocyclaceae bacterium]MBR4736346.1 sodium:alanine symporter family protein [Rhodocyclaceae bacterium]